MKIKACLTIPSLLSVTDSLRISVCIIVVFIILLLLFVGALLPPFFVGDFLFFFFFLNWHTINSPPQGFSQQGWLKTNK